MFELTEETCRATCTLDIGHDSAQSQPSSRIQAPLNLGLLPPVAMRARFHPKPYRDRLFPTA
jgi:hypothetical protein